MKLAGCTVIKNEERLIEANLRHHLEHQGFDILLVIDNGSYDRTLEIVQGIGDSRIVVSQTKPNQGHRQGYHMTIGAHLLFNEYKADWVAPFDADEFWTSERHGTVRSFLESVPDEVDVVVTQGYRFHETELDDPAEANPFRRLLYARPEPHPRVVLHKMGGGRLLEMPIGMHWVSLRDEEKPNQWRVDRADMARFHYRHLDVDDFRRRMMNKAEGQILRLGREWLAGESEFGRTHRLWYRAIRDGRFEREYRKAMVLTRDTVEKEVARGELLRIGDAPWGVAVHHPGGKAVADAPRPPERPAPTRTEPGKRPSSLIPRSGA